MKTIHINKDNIVCNLFPTQAPNTECYAVEISDEQLNILKVGRVGYVWKYLDGQFKLEEHFDNAYIRRKRARLLEAFDKYKINVYYGIEQETQEDKATILTWYYNLLNLSADAIKNIPSRIKYYIGQ